MRGHWIILIGVGFAALTACGADEPAPTLTGTYALDEAATERAHVEAALEKASDTLRTLSGAERQAREAEIRDGALAAARRRLEGLRIETAFLDDGACAMRAVLAGVRTSGRGTWTLEGETLTIRSTHSEGRPVSEPRVMRGRVRDGRITMRDPTGWLVVLRPR